jgi:3',5'-cyclic AMP phosphodiesterase CpdA
VTTLFHVSDVHFGVEDMAAHDWFARAVARERPAAVICTGDITQRAKHREYAAARAWFGALGVPVLIEPGNHDLPYYNLAERFFTPFKRYDALAAAVAAPRPALDGVAIVPLRTTVSAQSRFPWSDGVVKPAAIAETVAELERLASDPRLKLITCHHPLMEGPPGAPGNPTIGGDAAFLALARAGADAVLSGHVHNAFDLTFEVEGHPLRMIGAGTLSTRLRGSGPSYNVLRHNPGRGLEVEQRQWDAG